MIMATLEFVLCLYIFSTLQSYVHSAQFDFGRVEFSKRLDGYVLKTKYQLSLRGCWHECSVRAKCLSFNYFRFAHKCELNTVRISDLSGISTHRIGYVYWERDKVQATLQCGGNVCSENETCDVDTNMCLTKECPNMLTINADITQGNLNDVGSKAVVECGVSINLEPTFVQTECQTNGTWRNEALSCLQGCGDGWYRTRSRCYKITPIGKTWQDAQDYCKSMGANLVKVDDEFEQQFITTMAKKHGERRYWIGLRFYSELGEFRWTDMSNLDFNAWYYRQPDVYDCVELTASYQWLWNDYWDCYDSSLLSICEMAVQTP